MGFKWALIALAMTARADDDDDGGAGSINCAGPLVATQATPASQCPNIAMLHYWPINENFDCHGWRGTNIQNGNSAPASANNIRMSDDCETLTMTHYSGNLICAGDGVEQSFALGECTAGMGNLFNKGRDFDCCSSPDSCAYSDGVPSFESLQLANVTVYRDGRPCRHQGQEATTEAPTSWCHDDPDWRSQLLTNRGCNWVASEPADRCGLMGANESSYAHEHCLEACGCTSAPSVAPGSDDADCPSDDGWHIRDKPSKDCGWVGFAPGDRCGKLDEDGVRAYDACQAECGCSGAPSLAPTEAPTDCANDPDWYKEGRPDRTCDYVADKPKSRCDAEGEDGRIAWEACSLACGCTSMPSIAPTGEPTREPIIDPTPEPSAAPAPAPTGEPTTCPQSATWYKEGSPEKDCDWVGQDPGGRCHKVGENEDLAWEACERACGCTSAPSEAPTAEPTAAPVGTPTPAPSAEPTSAAPTPAPSSDPTIAPTGEPTLAPTGCPNSNPSWHLKDASTQKGCDWVADKAWKRCPLEGEDGSLAFESCEQSCGCTHPPSPAPSPEPSATPSAEPSPAPSATPSPAPSATPSATPTASPTRCPNDPNWFRKKKPKEDCLWVAKKPAGRCEDKSRDGVLAWTVCEESCGCTSLPSAAPTGAPTVSPTLCPEDTTWHKVDEPDKSCEWVGKKTDRCEVVGADERVAFEACQLTCGCSSPPTPSPSHDPTAEPTPTPTSAPTHEPTAAPTAAPSFEPTFAPTHEPTADPTFAPTRCPEDDTWFVAGDESKDCSWVKKNAGGRCEKGPSLDGRLAYQACELTCGCTVPPTSAPSANPTPAPSATPTPAPSPDPTAGPTPEPSFEPTFAPTHEPSAEPTFAPTRCPEDDTWFKESRPLKNCEWVAQDPPARCDARGDDGRIAYEACEESCGCTTAPTTAEPSLAPTGEPTLEPTLEPTVEPTKAPTGEPSLEPTEAPTPEPSRAPTAEPTVPGAGDDGYQCEDTPDRKWAKKSLTCVGEYKKMKKKPGKYCQKKKFQKGPYCEHSCFDIGGDSAYVECANTYEGRRRLFQADVIDKATPYDRDVVAGPDDKATPSWFSAEGWRSYAAAN